VRQRCGFSACESVLAAMKSTPVHAFADHVIDGVAAGAADADHLDHRIRIARSLLSR
jgi:hypothetical protein